MPPTSPTTAELLLDLLELTSLSATGTRQLSTELKKRYGTFSSLRRRIESGLATLESEGLVEAGTHLGRRSYAATPAGLQILEDQGRYPHGGTVLFTDLVGSTALIDLFGEDGAHEMRLRHFELLRSAVAKHGGREIKGLGDGLMIIFSSATPALACAASMQRNVAGDGDGLGLRVGLHTGPLLREDNDFHGTTVIVAARLCDRAQSGQVVVSDHVRATAEAEAGGGQPLTLLGDLALKGIAEPITAYELRWSDGSRRAAVSPSTVIA
ncbi:MAG: adenylate/guanylate cyclase domain-containing protein [Solirubrobacteraceae bacterium]|nr:adenylate/guanylate cyclase domain-containing protein [Solirubrobacteraceae bacterium]